MGQEDLFMGLTIKAFSFRPCAGRVVSDFSISQPDEKMKSYFAKVIGQYKKYKKMYTINDRLFSSDNEKQFDVYDSELKLRYLKINFHATSFDRITKDRAAKFVDMLSAIGGTMGLLTGFSIISGVEIFYFGVKIIHKTLMGFLQKKNKQ